MKTAILALIFFVSATLCARAEECTLTKVASLPLEDFEGKVPVVTVNINGSPLKFVVSTAATHTGITAEAAESLNLKPRAIESREIYTGSGEQIDHYANVQSMRIGNVLAKDVAMMIWPRGYLHDVDGNLGVDYLAKFDLDFDFAAKTLNLFSPNHCEGRVVYWAEVFDELPFRNTSDRQIEVTGVLDGKKISCIVATNASQSSLLASRASELFGLTPASPGSELLADGNSTPVAAALTPYRYQFGSMVFEGLTVVHPFMIVVPNMVERSFRRNHTGKQQFDIVARAHLDVAGSILGMNVLSKLHLYIAYKEKKIYLTDANAGK